MFDKAKRVFVVLVAALIIGGFVTPTEAHAVSLVGNPGAVAAANAPEPLVATANIVPTYTQCPSGYRCFFEHKNYQGARSMYNSAPGVCATFPHGPGFVGDAVTSMFNRQSRSVEAFNQTACAGVIPQFTMRPGTGYNDLTGVTNDKLSSAKQI